MLHLIWIADEESAESSSTLLEEAAEVALFDSASLPTLDADVLRSADGIVVADPDRLDTVSALGEALAALPPALRPTLLAARRDSSLVALLEAGADDAFRDRDEVSERLAVLRKHRTELMERMLEMEEELLASPRDWVLILDAEGRIERSNRIGEQVTGRPLDRIEGASIADVESPWRADHERARAALLDHHSEITYRSHLRHADGTVRDIEVTSRPRRVRGQLVGAITVVRDVTEQALEQELESTRTAILDSIVQERGQSSALEKICHILESRLEGGRCWILLRDDENRLATGAAPSLPRAFTSGADGKLIGEGVGVCGTAIHRNEVVAVAEIATSPLCAPFRDKALELGLRSVWSTPVRDSDGTAIGSFAVYHDTEHEPSDRELRLSELAGSLAEIVLQRAATERRLQRSEESRDRTREELESSQHVLEELVAHSPIGIQFFDAEGVARKQNQAIRDIFGLPSADYGIGRYNVLTDPWARDTGVAALAAQAYAGHSTPPAEFQLDLDRAAEPWEPGRETCWVEVQFFPLVIDGEIEAVAAFVRDTTRRRMREEALRQAQKMESLGVLAGGIAHDFNNLLVGMLGNASLALQVLPAEAEAASFVRDIELASRRAAELAGQMLEYSGRGRSEREEVDLNEVLEETGKLVRSSLPSGATLEFDLAPRGAVVSADPTQLRQLVMNLIINAGDSLDRETGVIRVSTQRRTLTSVISTSFIGMECPPGEYVELRVSDDGCGIAAEDLEKIFDPFFSTKFTGRGLGLASVHGIVRAHGGSIQVTSAPGQGTTFSVLVPAGRSAGDAGERPARGGADADATGPVLIIDDEETVRIVAARLLDSLGHPCVAVADGPTGLRLVREQPHGYRCVLLDLTMPGMGGGEVFDQLRELAPALPVVLITGFDAHGVMARFGERQADGFLQKPFDLPSLGKVLREVLSQGARRPAR